MDTRDDCPLAIELAHQLRDAREQLTRRWLERITARVSMDANRIFPTKELLDHIPLLLIGMADHIENPTEEISTHLPVVAKAMELGELRHAQGFDAHEILKEYEILGGVLFAFLIGVVDDIPKPCSRGELLACAQRLFRGISLVQQVTTNHYLRAMNERIRERENRLRGFNRMVSHELKNRIGALQGAGELLGVGSLSAERRDKLQEIISENTQDITALIDNLSKLSRLDADVVRHDVPLRQSIAEAVRQLRDLAEERNVEVRITEDLPDIRVNAAAVELCLSNYLGNAIKYSDPRKRKRWAEIRAHVRPRDKQDGRKELVVEVQDNGLGIPQSSRARLFERFFRAVAEDSAVQEGTGLGLSIVRDTVESLGGNAWVVHHDDGSTFAFSLPLTPAPRVHPRPSRETTGSEV
jgi:signal transduction histidine kinase